ncbi:ring finger domain-containing protein [Ditylenchus destructor]|uniref:Ring finger domain-containing protein n=1 Tax=Ditylenchus destructor TaxID=166010 RepID=A0AAD4R2Y6_9BILA|nr:ring finger domain-containing protein [Ditylenchus destructor]
MTNFLCIICVDGITSETDVCSLPCGHVYHNECIKDWCNDNSMAEIEILKDELAKSRASNDTFQRHIDELHESNRSLQQQVCDHEVRLRETLKCNHDLSDELRMSEDISRDFIKRVYMCRAKISSLEATNRENEIRINQQMTDLENCRKEKMKEISCLQNALNAAIAEHETEREKWRKKSQQIQRARLETIHDLQQLKIRQCKKNADLKHRISLVLQLLNEVNPNVAENEMGILMSKENYDPGMLQGKRMRQQTRLWKKTK